MQSSNRYFGCGGHYGIDDPNPEVLEGSYIFFDAGVTVTKGTLINDTTPLKTEGSSLGVLGFRPDGADIFLNHDNHVAQLTWGNSQFNYSPLALWHAGEHMFHAYYPYGESTTAGKENDRPYVTYTQPTGINAMVDFMTASTVASSGSPVTLPFVHRLFAFEVVLRNQHAVNPNQPSETVNKFRVKAVEVAFKAVTKSAKFYFNDADNDGNLDYVRSNDKIELIKNEFGSIDIPAPSAGESHTNTSINGNDVFLFIPSPTLTVSCSMTYTNAWNEDCTYTLSDQTLSPTGGFLPGKKYALVIKKSQNGDLVEFTPSLELVYDGTNQWDETTPDIDIEFN